MRNTGPMEKYWYQYRNIFLRSLSYSARFVCKKVVGNLPYRLKQRLLVCIRHVVAVGDGSERDDYSLLTHAHHVGPVL